jgi:hypothetical protein
MSPLSIPAGSSGLRVGFVALTAVLGTLFILAVYWSSLRTGLARPIATRRAAIAGGSALAWIVLTGAAASSGLLHFTAPPTMLLAIVLSVGLAIGLGLSPFGRRIALGLPVVALVSYQAFRIVVELLMHRAYLEGLMPVQMSYSGRNFDIVSGVTALALGGWLATGRSSRRLLVTWNTLGALLLANILIVAFLSAPTPMRQFMNEPANNWITRAPWVWLPTVMVFAAVFGHVALYRRIANTSAAVPS